MGHLGRIGALTAVAAAAALALPACSSAGSGGSGAATSSAAASSPAGATSSAAAKGSPVDVVEKEFSITLTPTALHPGTVSFTVHNEGTFPHNLNVSGPGVTQQASPTLSPGQTAVLTVTLQPGSYELWCSVDSHKDRGMDQTVKVG